MLSFSIRSFIEKFRWKKPPTSLQIQRGMREADEDAVIQASFPIWAVVASGGNMWLAMALAASQGIHQFSRYLADRKSREFVELLIEGQLSSNDLRVEGLIEGLRRTSDVFMVERNQEKREIIKRIFLGFISSNDRQHFLIEKMYRTLDFLEIEDVEALRFARKHILTKRFAQLKSEYEEGLKKGEIDKPFDQFFRERKIKHWILNKDRDEDPNHNLNSEVHRAKDNLESLRIIEPLISSDRLQEEGARRYRFTSFGFDFCLFVSDDDALSIELKELCGLKAI